MRNEDSRIVPTAMSMAHGQAFSSGDVELTTFDRPQEQETTSLMGNRARQLVSQLSPSVSECIYSMRKGEFLATTAFSSLGSIDQTAQVCKSSANKKAISIYKNATAISTYLKDVIQLSANERQQVATAIANMIQENQDLAGIRIPTPSQVASFVLNGANIVNEFCLMGDEGIETHDTVESRKSFLLDSRLPRGLSAFASVIHLITTTVEVASLKDFQVGESIGEVFLAARDLILAGRHFYNASTSNVPRDNVLNVLGAFHLLRAAFASAETILENLGDSRECKAAAFGMAVLLTSLIIVTLDSFRMGVEYQRKNAPRPNIDEETGALQNQANISSQSVAPSSTTQIQPILTSPSFDQRDDMGSLVIMSNLRKAIAYLGTHSESRGDDLTMLARLTSNQYKPLFIVMNAEITVEKMKQILENSSEHQSGYDVIAGFVQAVSHIAIKEKALVQRLSLEQKQAVIDVIELSTLIPTLKSPEMILSQVGLQANQFQHSTSVKVSTKARLRSDSTSTEFMSDFRKAIAFLGREGNTQEYTFTSLERLSDAKMQALFVVSNAGISLEKIEEILKNPQENSKSYNMVVTFVETVKNIVDFEREGALERLPQDYQKVLGKFEKLSIHL